MAVLYPHEGGCWFCNQDNEHEDLIYDCEFDTFLHWSCLKKTLEEYPDHPEAMLMKYLL